MTTEPRLRIVPPPAPGEPLLDADQVAELLNVSRSKVYALATARQLAHIRLDKQLRFRRAAVDAYLASREVQAEC